MQFWENQKNKKCFEHKLISIINWKRLRFSLGASTSTENLLPKKEAGAFSCQLPLNEENPKFLWT